MYLAYKLANGFTYNFDVKEMIGMRLDVKKNPSVRVKNDREFRKVKELVTSKRVTLLDEKEYQESVQTASNLLKKAAFIIR
ncbi:hypothetical protein IGI69_002173 [Enterococcus sp. DIV1083b]